MLVTPAGWTLHAGKLLKIPFHGKSISTGGELPVRVADSARSDCSESSMSELSIMYSLTAKSKKFRLSEVKRDCESNPAIAVSSIDVFIRFGPAFR
jgi:hypothetical protein